MKNIMFLVVASLIFVSGCGKKAEEAKVPSEFEEMAMEVENMPAEGAVKSTEMQTKQGEVALPQPVESKIESVESVEQQPKPAAVSLVKPTVEEIQKALKNANLYEGKIDGVLGAKTRKAIIDFQTKNSLKADGKVGPKTWEKLKTYLSTASSSVAN
ncbi:MAG: peptidoglycan-binding domain-containing protein [Candidatus Omnitrophica bacterium]|nr:peptidoglycan-binding domain-containing protein [Candidatus Omnitrophota bacterium]